MREDARTSASGSVTQNKAVSRLHSLLLECYPQAVQGFPNLKHRAATTVFAVPAPVAATKLTGRRVVTPLKRSGCGSYPALAEQLLSLLRAPALLQPPQVEAIRPHRHRADRRPSGDTTSRRRPRGAARAAVRSPPASRYSAVGPGPGPGPGLAARVLGEIGDDPERFTRSTIFARTPAPRR